MWGKLLHIKRREVHWKTFPPKFDFNAEIQIFFNFLRPQLQFQCWFSKIQCWNTLYSLLSRALTMWENLPSNCLISFCCQHKEALYPWLSKVCTLRTLTHFILNRLSHTIYWKSLISIRMSSYIYIYIFLEKKGQTICKQWKPIRPHLIWVCTVCQLPFSSIKNTISLSNCIDAQIYHSLYLKSYSFTFLPNLSISKVIQLSTH